MQARTDGNGWQLVDDGVQRRWFKRLSVTGGFPVSPVYASMATTALPVGVATLDAVYHRMDFYADAWRRVLIVGPDATTASTALTYHGTATDGGNWSGRVAAVQIEVELIERLP